MAEKKRRIPDFASREEEAAFWDEHSIADYMDEMTPIDVGVSKDLSKAVSIRIDAKTLSELRERARRRGVGPTTLIRMIVLEWLQAQHDRTE